MRHQDQLPFLPFVFGKTQGRKLEQVKDNIDIEYCTTNSTINGMIYKTDDINQTYTLLLSRTKSRSNEPTYYRLSIESSDTNFTIEKFNENFIQEKWNCVSYQGMFSSLEKDYWNPNSYYPVSTCRQWY